MLSAAFDRRGWEIPFDGVSDAIKVGLKEVDIQIVYERPTGFIEARPISCLSEEEGNFVGELPGLGAWWVVKVANSGSRLMGKRLPNDSEDAICKGFVVNDELAAVMTARVSDCFVSLNDQPFEHLSDAKTLFVQHLAKLEALQEPEVILAEQLLKVVERL
jgi:hypothetical protein